MGPRNSNTHFVSSFNLKRNLEYTKQRLFQLAYEYHRALRNPE